MWIINVLMDVKFLVTQGCFACRKWLRQLYDFRDLRLGVLKRRQSEKIAVMPLVPIENVFGGRFIEVRCEFREVA